MNTTQTNAIANLANAINWLSTAFWYEHVDMTQVSVNIERAKANINSALEEIERYTNTLNK